MAFSITLFITLFLSPIQDDGVPMTDVEEVNIGCLNLNKLEETYIFNSEQELEETLYSFKSPHPNCSYFLFSDVDFATRTVVGVKISTTSCDKIQTRTSFFRRGEAVMCETNISPYNGGCRINTINVFWFSIPKTPSNQIKFRTTIK
ncbi:MAG: hypothetical protein ACMVP2_16470 [Imperialibacter sp.]|uniref:hypothetical protein n=1 Tax=Imperialibacter sp. TaxID=2038411 RepID=UPI0030D6FC79|tara:strand:- start:46770 stop:47210 length:441 start_codon:yes stop_codon:yes gene_type:complete